MPGFRKKVRVLLCIFAMALLSSCSAISYYSQSVAGQLELISLQRTLSEVMNSTDTSVDLKERLARILEIRVFASEVLKLPNNNSYRSYADIGRKFIVWNVFATPELSLQPHQSCFLFVGCLSYRGYFKKTQARAYKQSLENQGYDVYLAGVAAYSTLGWFDDPILNSMLDRDDIDLARLIFHELAHQQLYIKDDSEFNEAFADAVASIGLDYWLEARSTHEMKVKYDRKLAREDEFNTLVLSYQHQLQELYDSPVPEAEKRALKSDIFRELQVSYQVRRAGWGGYDAYDNWFKDNLNNAKVAAVSTYRNLVPLFLLAYKSSEEDIEKFFNRARDIGLCDKDRRLALLRSKQPQIEC
jgi:predicted aminopeptidase